MRLEVYEDSSSEDAVDSLIALADKVGIALAIDGKLKFQAYRFNLDGSLQAMSATIEKAKEAARQAKYKSGEF